jgi:hypothetical protein
LRPGIRPQYAPGRYANESAIDDAANQQSADESGYRK